MSNLRHTVGNQGLLESYPKSGKLALEPWRLALRLWRLVLEPWRLVLWRWRLALEPWMLSLHRKKSWRKTPPAWPDVTDSLVRGTENFLDMKIALIRRVPTKKTEYFKNIGISRRFFVLPRRSVPTIFRQLSDEWIIKSRTCGTRTHDLQGYNPLLYHCATLTLYEILWQHYILLAWQGTE